MKIAIALSGGVDSTVAALQLINQGHELIALTLKLQKDDTNTYGCASNQAIQKAINVANNLNIPIHIIDAADTFQKEVLQYAWDNYKTAKTPNPCIKCNKHIKFGTLLQTAQKLQCSYLATGHYVQKQKQNDRYYIKRADYSPKDQSYFLALLDSETIEKLIFPLAELTKPEVRQIAEKHNLISANAPDSQNVCITEPNLTFAQTLQKIFKESPPKANFIDTNNNILGKHNGVHLYTIGQRRGIGNFFPTKSAYALKFQNNNLVLTDNPDKLLTSSILVNNLICHLPQLPETALVQIRYRHTPVMANIQKNEDNYTINFHEPVRAPAPGQMAVFYQNNLLIAAATIQHIPSC